MQDSIELTFGYCREFVAVPDSMRIKLSEVILSTQRLAFKVTLLRRKPRVKPVNECEVGTLRSLGARPSQPKRLLRRGRQGGGASAFAVPNRLRPAKGGGGR